MEQIETDYKWCTNHDVAPLKPDKTHQIRNRVLYFPTKNVFFYLTGLTENVYTLVMVLDYLTTSPQNYILFVWLCHIIYFS